MDEIIRNSTPPPAPSPPTIPSREIEREQMEWLMAKRDLEQEAKMKQKEQQFVLVGAIETEDIQKINELIRDGVNINAEIIFTKTPLTHAIELGLETVALLLLDHNCDPCLQIDNFPHSQPIHLAAKYNLPRVIKKLIEKGVDLNVWDSDQMSPLTLASYHENVEVVNQLIDNGADINFQDSCYRSPLHRAVESGSKDTVFALIAQRADINATDFYGWTPLHLAIALDYPDIVHVLLDNKCDLEAVDINGNTPMCIACDFLNRQNVNIVRQTQFSCDARRIDFLQGRYLTLLQKPREEREKLRLVFKLIESGANVDGSSNHPITVAAEADHADTVHMLISSGAWIPRDWIILSSDKQVGIKMKNILDWLKLQYSEQYSLLWQCKRCVRRCVRTRGRTLVDIINSLPLPTSMKTYLH